MSPIPKSKLAYEILQSEIITNLHGSSLEDVSPGNALLDEEVTPELLAALIDQVSIEQANSKSRFGNLLDQHSSDLKERNQLIESLKLLHESYFQQLSNIHSMLSTPGPETEEENMFGKQEKVSEDLKIITKKYYDQRARVEALNYISELHELYKDTNKARDQCKYYQAVKLLSELEVRLDEERVENLSQAAQSLKDWVHITQTQLIGSIDTFLWQVLVLEKSSESTLISIHSEIDSSEYRREELGTKSKGLLDELITCRESLGGLEFIKDTLLSFFSKYILVRLIENPLKIELNYENSPPTLRYTKISLDSCEYYKVCSRSLASLLTLLTFLSDNLPQQLIPKNYYESTIAPLILDNLLVKSIPTSRAAFDGFSKLASDVGEFEQKLRQQKFYQLSDPGPLTSYVGRAEQLYLDRRQEDLLVLARAILLDPNPGLIMVNEKELSWSEAMAPIPMPNVPELPEDLKKVQLPLPLLFPKCQVPDTIPRLLSTIESYLLESTTMESSDSAKANYLATRAVVDLYLALGPLRASNQLKGLKGAAMLHNESFYLAHKLRVLGFKVQPHFSDFDWNPCYVDFHTPLLALAHKSLAIPLAKQQEEALIILQDLNNEGLRDLDQPKRADTAQEIMGQVLDQVMELVNEWQPILPAKLFETAVGGQLLAPVCQWVLDQIMDLVDIGEKDSYVLQSIIAKLIGIVEDLLPHTTAQAQVLAYSQLSHLANTILTGSLAEIQANYANYKTSFTNQQLANLIMALFGDSPARTAFVKKLLK